MKNMKYPLGTKVKLTEKCYFNMAPDIDKDIYLKMVGTIIGYEEDEDYPYIIEFSKDDWENRNSSYCIVSESTLNYNGSVFDEDEFFVIQIPLPSEISNYNMKEDSEYAKQIAEMDRIFAAKGGSLDSPAKPNVEIQSTIGQVKSSVKKVNYTSVQIRPTI